jgi:urea transport system ATP-binding protein
MLAKERGMAVVLVEPYDEFARSLGDRLAIMARGEVALAGPAGGPDEDAVRAPLKV